MEDSDINIQGVIATAKELVGANKGILAMDESNPTCNKRFAQFGIPQTPDARRDFRELILSTPDLGKFISGVILYDETVRQFASDGGSFVSLTQRAGIIPGIKVDTGSTNMAGFPGEKTTSGLDGLRTRLNEYASMGLRFAKWRAVITIGNGMPTDQCIQNNMHILSQYAALCQESGIMPIVEPEVLMDGDHSLAECFEVTERVIRLLFIELYKQRVVIEGLLVKPNMIMAGKSSIETNSICDVAEATVKCLLRCIPAAVPGVAFLSGGQDGELATNHLNEMNRLFKSSVPWVLTFSFSRAILLPVLEIWRGDLVNKVKAQQELCYRAKGNSDARWGEYNFAVKPERKPDIFK